MSISNKITLVVSLLAGLLLAATGYAGIMLRQREAQAQLRTQAQLFAAVLKLAAESSLQNVGQMGALESLVGHSTRASVTFFDVDGYAVAPVPAEETPVVNSRALRVMERKAPEEDLAANAYAYRVPLLQRGQVAGALELRLGLEGIWRVEPSYLALLAAGGFLLLFVVLVGIYSRTSIARPIDQLMGGMDHVIKGDLTVALPLDRNDEIGRLAYRFNEMTAQLRDAQEEIRRNAGAKLQLEQGLRQSEKLATIGQLSAEIAHEVGTPLNVIGARARAMGRKAEQPAEVRKNSQIIADQAARITKIIQQMLDLSRARSPEKTQVELRRIIEDALLFLEHQIERSAIEVVPQLADHLPVIQGDADGLQQVFLNLLVNAIQAMPQGGTLTIQAMTERRRKEGLDLAPPQQFARVDISDTGPGIPPEEQSRIFEPFYSTKPKGEGTGLGLTVVHGIVKEHDGWIEVSGAEPRGTVFRVYLPAEEPEAPGVDDTRKI